MNGDRQEFSSVPPTCKTHSDLLNQTKNGCEHYEKSLETPGVALVAQRPCVLL